MTIFRRVRAILVALARLDVLTARVAELERRLDDSGAPHYAGLWEFDRAYRRGAFVTAKGSLWACMVDGTLAEPGRGSPDWRLAVKRGRDGRDVRLQ